MRRAALWACGAWLAVATAAQAQTGGPLFREVTDTHLPAVGAVANHSMDVESADLDGDGDLDLVVAQEWLPNLLLINDGQGRFTDASDRIPVAASETPAPLPQRGHDSEDVSIADFNGDGRLDLIIVSEDDVKGGRTEVHEYWRGLAGGRFERIPGVLPDTEANAVAHADINGDRRPDILIAGFGQDRLLISDGRGGFRDETAQRLPRDVGLAQDAEFADIDRDGNLDIVLALEGGHALWLNDGRGRFSDVSAERLPRVEGLVEARKVAPVDVDGDGDLDLYFAHVGWQGRAPQDRLFLNDGRGRFIDGTEGRIPAEDLTSSDARFADLDGDGDPDMIRGNRGPLQFFENDGHGRFTDVTARWLETPVEGSVLGIEIADFNGDGANDLYIAMLNTQQVDPDARDRLLLGWPRVNRR